MHSSVEHEPWDNDHFYYDLPDPTGQPPFRLGLEEVLADDEIKQIETSKELVFQTTGDTGAIRGPFQAEVAELLVADADKSNVKFLYHLGDVVYDYGEDREYPGQFYDVYANYLYPIFAIPGNHDGARYDGSPDSLRGFMRNFCSPKPQMPPSIERTGRYYGRDTMTQPNCYWTLNTPVATIVGLYTNVPSGGDVREPQTAWFAKELKAAPAGKPLIVAMHHPVHSIALGSHAGSKAMDRLLLDACKKAKRTPELVICGHVHNYQRFETTFLGKPCTFVVAGMGGHAKDKLKGPFTIGQEIAHEYPVKLKAATDKHVGLVRVAIKGHAIHGEYVAVGQKQPIDTFDL
jgi:3',5'-cyclic AMP phosphodiesterase CpdA